MARILRVLGKIERQELDLAALDDGIVDGRRVKLANPVHDYHNLIVHLIIGAHLLGLRIKRLRLHLPLQLLQNDLRQRVHLLVRHVDLLIERNECILINLVAKLILKVLDVHFSVQNLL